MNPEITVIIPTHERPASLRLTLAALSTAEPGPGGFEVIVVDDGSTTDLSGLVREFDSSLDLTLLRQANSGPAAARNHGAAQARGSLLAFTDDDCRPDSRWISALREAHRQEPDALVGGWTLNGLPDNRWAATSQVIVDMARNFYTDVRSGPRFFASNNFAVPSALFAEMGGFCEGFRVAAEDREFCDRWFQLGHPLRYEPRAVVSHLHDLGARAFWRQHYRYGFGAWRFHSERRRRQSGRMRDDLRFHLRIASLLRQATPGMSTSGRLRLVPRLIVWQVANAVGFLGGLVSGVGAASSRALAKGERS